MTAPELPFYPITHDDGLSIVDALNDIADTQNSPSLIAEDFDETKNYAIGDYVIYSACLYRFVAPHSAGAWNSGHATQVRVGEELGEKASNSIVAPAFRSEWNYDVDDVVTYQGGLYRFITAHSAGAWNRSQVVTTNAISEGGGGGGGGGGAGIGDVVTFDEHTMIVTSSERTLEPLESSIAIVANGDTHIAIDSGQYVYVKNHGALDEGLYIAKSDILENAALTNNNITSVTNGGLNKLNSNISDSFNPETAYKIGDIVMYNGTLYKFTAAHSAGAWVGTDAVQVTVDDELFSLDLKEENQLTANDDLNNVLTGGAYWAGYSNLPVNRPTDAFNNNSFIFVINGNTLPILETFQIYCVFQAAAPYEWVRRYYNGEWGPWFKYYSKSEIDNLFTLRSYNIIVYNVPANGTVEFQSQTYTLEGYKPIFYTFVPGGWCDLCSWSCGSIGISGNSVVTGNGFIHNFTTGAHQQVYLHVKVLWMKL